VARRKTAPNRVLAIDYGRKRIGLALSDELRMTAQPLAILVRKNRRSDIRRLRQTCRDRGVAQIVVGQPLHLSGESSVMAEEAARFAARLQKELGIPVELQDERLTSWEAEQMAAQLTSPFRRQRQPIDAVAAALVLREYLDRKRRGPAAGQRV
jgi:putative holliday junction resolvase